MEHARGRLRCAAVCAALASGIAFARQSPPVEAVRAHAPLRIDGRLDEPAWDAAPVFDAFVESFPNAGAPPAFRTEARVLFDDSFLYVGVKCFDPRPDLVGRQLSRRDRYVPSDEAEVAIDAASDGRSAFDFAVNAAGVQRDQILYGDFNANGNWDGVWEGAASVTGSGWEAEFAIPLRLLRFRAHASEWRILIRRRITRTHEIFDSTLIPREKQPVNANTLSVSSFGPLRGVGELEPRREAEWVPYAAGKLVDRPQYSDPTRSLPRLVDPILTAGLDFKVALTSRLLLTGALNPDFGQVEADTVIQNLATIEPWFPEKRPLFLEGLDIFQPVGAEYGSPQVMLYTRRVGLTAPILGAFKLSGSVADGLDVGLLEALVLGAGNPSAAPIGYETTDPTLLAPYEAAPDRRWQLHLQQPLWLGPNDALPNAHPVTTNYLAAIARQRFGQNSSAGLVFTSAVPLEPQCNAGDFSSLAEYAATDCSAWGANALALDWNLRSPSTEWGFLGQVDGSQEIGRSSSGRLLEDGTLLRPGDFGFGTYARAGKLGGEPFRFDVAYERESPKLDLNEMGYQAYSNLQVVSVDARYVRPNGFHGLHNFTFELSGATNYTATSPWIPRSTYGGIDVSAQLPGYESLGCGVSLISAGYDPREIEEAGEPFERLPSAFGYAWFTSDRNKRLVVYANASAYEMFALGPEPPVFGWGWRAGSTWRPTGRLETSMYGGYSHQPQGARWVETVGSTAVFGSQDPAVVSLTLRQQYVVTTKLTFQLYAQFFSNVIRYGSFFEAPLGESDRVSAADLTPVAYIDPSPNAHSAILNVNAVVRWEYRLGSILFLVYTRSQNEEVPPVGIPVATTVAPSHFNQGPTTDSVEVKWSYWFD